MDAQNDYFKERQEMVHKQIKSRGIQDPVVLDAMKKVERHLFVPDFQKEYAYFDQALGIGSGQTISQPYVVAFTLNVLNLQKNHRVLEVGTGSGYLAALLGEIVSSVVTIEIIEELGDQAASLLSNLGYQNIRVIIGDGYLGHQDGAPYDAIIVSAAAPRIPPELLEQLIPGGHLIMPIGDHHKVQTLTLVTKNLDGSYKFEELDTVRFVPLTRNGN